MPKFTLTESCALGIPIIIDSLNVLLFLEVVCILLG